MNKRSITNIIILMSVAFSGMITLQYYFIQKAVDVNGERFNERVHAALEKVVVTLEEQETFFIIRQKMSGSVDVIDDFFSAEFDSSGNARWKEGKTIRVKRLVSSPSLESAGKSYRVEEETKITKTGVANKVMSPFKAGNSDEDSPQGYDTDTLSLGKIKNHNLERIVRMSEMVTGIVSELATSGQSIHERLSMPLVDSLIHHELVEEGVGVDYEFAIASYPDSKEVIHCSNASFTDDIMTSRYCATLFPSEILGSKYMLSVYFPDKASFLISNMWLVLIASIVLLLTIAFAFGYAIRTILKQKRMSEITKDFVSNMTHELKTPIATVSLATEALLDPDIAQLPNQRSRYLGIIKEENNRLLQQVEKVLQIARLDRKSFKLKIVTLDMHKLIEEAVQHIILQIENRKGKITLELDAEQPMIDGDELHLLNIVQNLLDNANKYSPDAPDITIKSMNARGGFMVSISDKGRGIPKDMVDKVFDKFYRVSTGNIHDVKGFGLGLSYVKTIVTALHGNISAKSDLNKGTTFTIFLPYKQEK